MTGDELKEALERADMTYRQLGERIGMSEDAVSNWARGKVAIRPVVEERIRGALAPDPVQPHDTLLFSDDLSAATSMSDDALAATIAALAAELSRRYVTRHHLVEGPGPDVD